MIYTIIILAPANSIHTVRWANGLSSNGHKIHLVSVHECIDHQVYDKRVSVTILKHKAPLGYFFAAQELKKIIGLIKPDIINTHYATGYGLLARLSKAHPLLLSVWGSDIYEFPKKSFLHRFFLKNNLKNADAIASTSLVMATEMLETYRHRRVFITPFGIDETLFYPNKTNPSSLSSIKIGTVKTLAPIYGIDTLIRAFAIVNRQSNIPVTLEIVGSGPQKKELIALSTALSLDELITFTDFIPHQDVPKKLNEFDIYVALSNQESFGVAILEANACGTPVVVSDAEGLKEVVINNQTGIIVPRNNPQSAAEALLSMIKDSEQRARLGYNGLQHVLNNYTWNHSLALMEQAYKNTIESYNK